MSNYHNTPNPREIQIPLKGISFLIGGAILIFILVIAASQATQVVDPGHRGVRVTLGKVSPTFEQEGFLVKPPFITKIYQVSIRQQTEEVRSECYSADLQQVKATVRVLYRVPESSVVALFQEYETNGDPFPSLIAPRVVEALKEVASTQSAEMIVQNREAIKLGALEAIRRKIGENAGSGPLVVIEDVTLSDLTLSSELNAAIEQKMTQREEAERAKFVQRRAEIEAQTAIIKARGDGEAIEIRGRALRENPAFIRLQIVEKWDGISPQVVGGKGESANVMIPLMDLDRSK
ncbi:MAG: prohibitin family protein [Verrucomicrobia bacterium]|nr:prohibitin family protein [Verrucomicrobiota bacterium]